jgi:endo-1,4-beta-xylanase
MLWPVNHKLIPIEANVIATDECDPDPEVRLVSITSSESDNGLGDGNSSEDIQGAEFGTDDSAFLLRAERSGRRNGRVYTIVYEAEDDSGNVATAEVMVTVPHSQKK